MTGVGLDLLEVERLERALERRPRLAERLFTGAERDYAAAKARPGMHLAARFCAKEAVAKALGLGRGASATWRWWHRRRAAIGAPERRPPSGRRSSESEPVVSLPHTQGMAGAVALLR